MSNSNKSVRQELERIYGKKCFIHDIPEIKRQISGYKTFKGRYKVNKTSNKLTYHHLKPKSEGGKNTIENGAVVCAECHSKLEKLKPAEREKINNMIRQYKLSVITFNTEEVKQVIEIPIEMQEYGVIKLESNKQRRQRLKRELKKELEELDNE